MAYRSLTWIFISYERLACTMNNPREKGLSFDRLVQTKRSRFDFQ